MGKPDKFDLDLRRWYFSRSVQGEDVYVSADDQADRRLGRYLMTEGELVRSYIGMDLWRVRIPSEKMGDIVEIVLDGWYGYWVVSKDGQVDIFSGKLGYRPLLLEG